MKGGETVNKREIQEKLWALWKLGKEGLSQCFQDGGDWLDWIVWQKKPNTAVRVIYHGKQSYYDFGFTKVQYPDTWDAQYGIDLAVKKALAGIARQIVEEG